ncbi:MAG: hypothetical protein IJ575_06825 [Selenomonadaceae bacterium]|nr:hypothetical protein [Selenomonadaceae bacterium]
MAFSRVLGILAASMIALSTVTNAMQFSQPEKLGAITSAFQIHLEGVFIHGATSNDGILSARSSESTKSYTKGIARWNDGDDALYCHYDSAVALFGSKDVSNTVPVNIETYTVNPPGEIFRINSDGGIAVYSIRFYHRTSHLTIFGRQVDGKWVKYVDSIELSKKYFGGRDSYTDIEGLVYQNVSVDGDTIVVPYFIRTNPDKNVGEFRFKWDDAAQWFSIEQIVY